MNNGSVINLEGDVASGGVQGYSAYEIAVRNGYVGTEVEWINSFLTPDGYYNKKEINNMIVDNLTSYEQKKPLSANQGRILNKKIIEAIEDLPTKDEIESLHTISPLVVDDVEDMTDTSRVYVNTTDGEWYHYDSDSTSWVSGGLYQSTGIADNSLDKKHLSNNLQDIIMNKESLAYNYLQDLCDESLFEQGGILIADGTIPQTTNSARIRTKDYLNVNVEKIKLIDSDNYIATLYIYNRDDDSYVRAYSTRDGDSVFNKTDSFIFLQHDLYKYKITLRKTNNGNLLPKECNKIMFLKGEVENNVDASLLKDNSIAPSKIILPDLGFDYEYVDVVDFDSEVADLDSYSNLILGRESATGIFVLVRKNQNNHVTSKTISLKHNTEYTIEASNMDRCRLALFNAKRASKYNESELVYYLDSIRVDSSRADKVLIFDDSLHSLDYTFVNTNYNTLIIDTSSTDIRDTISLKIKHKELKPSILPETIPDNSIEMNKLAFDIEELIGNVNLSTIHEFTNFGDDYVTASDNRTLNISSDEFLASFYDIYLGYNADNEIKVSKKSLGKDESDTYDIYEYDFCPKKYKQTILLTSGLHTYELSASFGLAYFIQELMDFSLHTDLYDYIRKNVRIKCIPIQNPWGWNQSPKKYGNVNGVNMNRNWDYDNKWEEFPDYSPNPEDDNYNEWNVKGSAPFSEKETRILRNWVNDNYEALFWIDCHTGLGYNQYDNWILYISDNSSSFKTKITDGLDDLRSRFKNTYGYTSRDWINIDSPGSIRHWYSLHEAGVPTMTIEQAPGNTRIGGTSRNNEGIDISEYAVVLYCYVASLLNTIDND